jgi:hypothetical protein
MSFGSDMKSIEKIRVAVGPRWAGLSLKLNFCRLLFS